MFSYKICETFCNTYFKELLRTSASGRQAYSERSELSYVNVFNFFATTSIFDVLKGF